MEPRPLLVPDEMAQILRLVALCHPARRERPPLYFLAHPTLVVSGGRSLVAYASFTVYPSWSNRIVMYLLDSGVHPEHRGQGHARRLLSVRLAIARAVGVNLVLGATQPENLAMRHLLAEAGLMEASVQEGFYTDQDPPADAIIYHLLMAS